MGNKVKIQSDKLNSRKDPSTLLIGVTVLVALILALILTFKLLQADKSEYVVETIPQVTNSSRLDFDINDLKGASQLANKSIDFTSLNAEAFKVKGFTQLEVVNLYKAEMSKQGWQSVTDGAWLLYRKGNKSVAIAATPVEEGNLWYMTEQIPRLAGQIQIGEVSVVVVQGPFEKVQAFSIDN